MKKILIGTAIIALTCTSALAQNAKKGWVKLFDGTTTNGWHTYGKTFTGKGWKAENGVLHFDPKSKNNDGGDIVTDNEYGNFHLKLEWKVAPKANSGIIFFVHEELPKYGQTYSTGPEMQVLDNDGHPDGKITKHRAGDLYDLVQSNSEPVKPVGEWNKAEIISNNGKLEFKLNGKKIVSTTMWDDNWRSLLAGSKFAKWEGFGSYKKGKIGLQDHGDEV
ncbi:MAG: DUF1080 domain-containing protein, partial [Sphingobacteriales bacterium]